MSSIGTRATARQAAGVARGAANSPWLDRLARVGLAARGLVYVLIGVLAVQIAFGGSGQSADQRGAFQTLAQNGLGKVLLWLVVLGFLGYAAWQATDAAWGHRGETDSRKRLAGRVEAGGKAVVYLALAVAAFRTVTSSGSGQGGSQTMTAKLLQMPGGQWLIGIVGLVVVGVALGLTWRGMRTDFEKYLEMHRMSPGMRKAAVKLGQVGYVARGVVFAIVGTLVIAAAVTFDPSKARGLDAALKELAAQPYGVWLLLAVALGLVCFGAYSFVESRYRRL